MAQGLRQSITIDLIAQFRSPSGIAPMEKGNRALRRGGRELTNGQSPLTPADPKRPCRDVNVNRCSPRSGSATRDANFVAHLAHRPLWYWRICSIRGAVHLGNGPAVHVGRYNGSQNQGGLRVLLYGPGSCHHGEKTGLLSWMTGCAFHLSCPPSLLTRS
jgi:hypothetical protein